jgi:hypothetical protein
MILDIGVLLATFKVQVHGRFQKLDSTYTVVTRHIRLLQGYIMRATKSAYLYMFLVNRFEVFTPAST